MKGLGTHQCTLTRFGIVQCGLHAVVAKGVTQKLFETAAVQQFLDQRLSGVMLGNTNALFDDVRAELLDRECADVAHELPNDSIAKPVIIEIEDILNNLKPDNEG